MDNIYLFICIIGFAIFSHMIIRMKRVNTTEHFGIFDGMVGGMINGFIGMLARLVKWVFTKMMSLIFKLFKRFLTRLQEMINYILRVTRANIKPVMKYLLYGVSGIIFVGSVSGVGLYLYRMGKNSVELAAPPVIVPSIGGRAYKQKYQKRN